MLTIIGCGHLRFYTTCYLQIATKNFIWVGDQKCTFWLLDDCKLDIKKYQTSKLLKKYSLLFLIDFSDTTAHPCFQYECIHFIYQFYSNHRVCYWFYLLQFKLFFCKFDTPPSIRHVIRAFKFDKVVPPFALNYIWIGWHIYSLFTL